MGDDSSQISYQKYEPGLGCSSGHTRDLFLAMASTGWCWSVLAKGVRRMVGILHVSRLATVNDAVALYAVALESAPWR